METQSIAQLLGRECCAFFCTKKKYTEAFKVHPDFEDSIYQPANVAIAVAARTHQCRRSRVCVCQRERGLCTICLQFPIKTDNNKKRIIRSSDDGVSVKRELLQTSDPSLLSHEPLRRLLLLLPNSFSGCLAYTRDHK